MCSHTRFEVEYSIYSRLLGFKATTSTGRLTRRPLNLRGKSTTKDVTDGIGYGYTTNNYTLSKPTINQLSELTEPNVQMT